MRVIHVFDHSIPLHSGYAFRSLAILRHQRRLGVDTWHLTGSKQGPCQALVEEVDGLRFYRTPPGPLRHLPMLGQYDVVRGLQRRLRQLCDELQPDLLHAHSPSLNAWAAARVARERRLPLVYEMRASWEDAAVSHGTCREGDLRYRVSQQLERAVLRRADHVVTICQGLANRVQQWGVGPERITVIPNGVNLDDFAPAQEKPAELLARYRLAGKTVLGFLGSFYRYEGLHLLIAALPEILRHHPEVQLLLVGGGPEETALKRQVAELGLEQQVTFTGRVPHQQIDALYALIDLFIYPRESILLTEIVTPLKPLEAMACGGLVLASDIGGHREMIEPGRNGVLFRADDVAALSEATVALLQQRDRWPEIRRAGRDYVAQHRRWGDAVKRILPVYEGLVKAPVMNGMAT